MTDDQPTETEFSQMELVATHYVIHDDTTIYGVGKTKGKAWANWYEEYYYGKCNKADELKCSPATHNLAHGIGSDWTQWASVGGIQCTLAEDEAQAT